MKLKYFLEILRDVKKFSLCWWIVELKLLSENTFWILREKDTPQLYDESL